MRKVHQRLIVGGKSERVVELRDRLGEVIAKDMWDEQMRLAYSSAAEGERRATDGGDDSEEGEIERTSERGFLIDSDDDPLIHQDR